MTDNPPIKIYVKIIENKIPFRIKKKYYLKFLTPETMKLLGSSKRKVTKVKNDGNVPHLKITDVAVVNCNVLNKNYQHNSEFCVHLFEIGHLVNY